MVNTDLFSKKISYVLVFGAHLYCFCNSRSFLYFLILCFQLVPYEISSSDTSSTPRPLQEPVTEKLHSSSSSSSMMIPVKMKPSGNTSLHDCG